MNLVFSLALLCFALAPFAAFGQEEELEIDLFFSSEEVVTSAARHTQDIGLSPSAITVFTREDIETTGATTIADLLRLVPGMHVSINNPFYSTIAARQDWSIQNDQFLVLLDGREINIEFLGVVIFESESISVDDIERIEVIRGPGSSLYGANATAGVISITTRSIPEKNSLFARLSGGENGHTIVDARASGRFGPVGVSLSAGAQRENSFTNPKLLSRDTWKIRTLGEWQITSDHRLQLDLSFAHSQGPLTTVLGPLENNSDLAAIRLAHQSDRFSSHLYWTMTKGTLQINAPLDFGGIRLAKFPPLGITSHTFDGDFQWTSPKFFGSLLLITGAGGRALYLTSDQLLDGQSFSETHEPGFSHWQQRLHLFLHSEYSPVSWLTVTGGLRLDYNSITDLFLSPRLVSVFNVAPGHFIRLGVARAFRKPSLLETHTHPMVTSYTAIITS